MLVFHVEKNSIWDTFLCFILRFYPDQEIPKPPSPQARQPEVTPTPQATAADLLKQGAACNVIYIGSVDTESLTGPPVRISNFHSNTRSKPTFTFTG